MTTIRQYLSNIDKPFLVLKWKVKVESHLFLSSTLLTYVCKNSNGVKDSDQEFKLKSNAEGMILKLLVKEGEIVQPGSPLLVLQSCTHELIVKEICAQCGADLWKSGIFQSLPETELKVTQEQAEQLEKAGERQLLKIRKLALLICADKTLVDTVHNTETSELSEAFCTKVRPGTRDFLKTISQLYELHIFVNGNPCYARKIADILDPSGELFLDRIWTRDKCFESETGNIKAIFPHGDSMVCIIDCQDDTFKDTASHVILIKPFPFHCMSENGQIPNVEDSNIFQHTLLTNEVFLDNVIHLESEGAQFQNAVFDDNNKDEILELLKETCDTVAGNSDSMEMFERVYRYSWKLLQNTMWKCLTLNEESLIGKLGTLLINIHKAYYDLYDQMVKQRMYIIHHKAIPDLRNVIPYFRQTILKGVNIVFSSIIPTNSDYETNPVCILAKSLGAKVSKELILHNKKRGTTHVIASKLGTNKTNMAKRFKNLRIVTVEWLFKCATCWEYVNETPFLLRRNSNAETGFPASTTKKIQSETVMHNISSQNDKQCDSGMLARPVLNKLLKFDSAFHNNGESSATLDDSESCLTAALNLSPKELKDMNSEVNEECTSDDSEEEDIIKLPSGGRKCKKRHTYYLKRSISDCNGSHYSGEIGSLSPTLSRNGSFKKLTVPFWERPCDIDSVDHSDSESGCDYVYSEDEDNLIG